MGKKWRFGLFAAVFLGLGAAMNMGLSMNSGFLSGYAGLADSAAKAETKARLAEIYTLNFTLARVPVGSVNIYLPQYTITEHAQALRFFGIFGFDVSDDALAQNKTETDAWYRYETDGRVMTVYKFGNTIHYTNTAEGETGEEIRSDMEAVAVAESFVRDKMLPLNYETAEVRFDSEALVYEIRFIGRIGNIKNYAFPTRVAVDRFGRIVEMEHHHRVVERLGSTPLISMESAFLELPTGFPTGTNIHLLRGDLVYIFEDSIIQPAYLFEGSLDGDTFQAFVKAGTF